MSTRAQQQPANAADSHLERGAPPVVGVPLPVRAGSSGDASFLYRGAEGSGKRHSPGNDAARLAVWGPPHRAARTPREHVCCIDRET